MLGVLCGLEAEAALARRKRGAAVACSAARPDKARERARELVCQGATHLLSFGLAGALKPGLNAGDLILGLSVRSTGGQWACDSAMLARTEPMFPEALSGPLYGTEKIIAASSDKHLFYRKYGCLAADMESQAVAEIAQEARVPFSVVRVIADTAPMNLPKAALVPLLENGRVDGIGVTRSLIKNPFQIPALVHVGISSGKAMRKLRAYVEAAAQADLWG
jgi:adenosylhomocysteine nucleosidase